MLRLTVILLSAPCVFCSAAEHDLEPPHSAEALRRRLEASATKYSSLAFDFSTERYFRTDGEIPYSFQGYQSLFP